MALELADDILIEILLRLPPDDPACLLRASLACKRWRRLLADPSFRRRHRELHQTSSVVGFIRIVSRFFPFSSRFIPNGPTSGRLAGRELPGWFPLDCRHGRALFVTLAQDAGSDEILDFLVWNPLTNERRLLPRPSPPPSYRGNSSTCFFNAAVLCAAATEGCDHSDCHTGPFLVVFIWSRRHGFGYGIHMVTSACVYSSVTGNWSTVTCVQHPYFFVDMCPCPSALVGNKIYFRGCHCHTLEYQLGTQRLSVIDMPPLGMCHEYLTFLLSGEYGKLEFVGVEDEPSVHLRLWSLETTPNGASQWAQGRTFDLEKLLPDGTFPAPRFSADHGHRLSRAGVLGFAEGTDVIFVGTNGNNTYMIQLNSGKVRKLFDDSSYVIPFTSFCIPVKDEVSNGEGQHEGAGA